MEVNPTLALDVVKLADIGSELINASTEIENYNADLYQAVADLNEGWSGESYDAFVTMMNKYKKTLESFPPLFAAYANKVNEFDKEGDALINTVAKELKIGMASSSYYLAPTQVYTDGIYVDYDVDWTPENSKDARKQAESVQSNLQADIDVLKQEKRNIDINLAALLKNKDNLGSAEYERLKAQLEKQLSEVENVLSQYIGAKSAVDALLERKFGNGGEDGLLIDGYEYFGLKQNSEKAKEGTEKLKEALKGLPPIASVVESANVNAMLTNSKDEYLYRQHDNGASVSDTMMDAAYTIASKNNQTEQVTIDGKQVTFFNSQALINQGLTDESGQLYDLTDRIGVSTFGQNKAYEDDYGNKALYSGQNDLYDSVIIKNEYGEDEYMTYAQYMHRYGDKE